MKTILWRLLKTHRNSLAVLFLGVLAPLLIFGRLSSDIYGQGGFWWDAAILKFVHSHANSQADWWVTRLTIVGGLLGVPGIVVAALSLRYLVRHPVGAFFFAVSVTGAWALNFAAKLFFRRVRPSLWISPLPETDYSFPSGHAMISTAIAVALVLLVWKTRLRWMALFCALIAVAGVGLSRLYLGVHYPSDILAGWCASLLWVLGVHWILFGWLKDSEWLLTNRLESNAGLTSNCQ